MKLVTLTIKENVIVQENDDNDNDIVIDHAADTGDQFSPNLSNQPTNLK